LNVCFLYDAFPSLHNYDRVCISEDLNFVLHFMFIKALSQRTLVMLMGVDPAKSSTEVISNVEPHVAFAYMKHLWNSDKKVSFVFELLVVLSMPLKIAHRGSMV